MATTPIPCVILIPVPAGRSSNRYLRGDKARARKISYRKETPPLSIRLSIEETLIINQACKLLMIPRADMLRQLLISCCTTILEGGNVDPTSIAKVHPRIEVKQIICQ